MVYYILVVEDDIALNNGVVLSLRQKDFNIIQSFSLNEARDRLKEQEFHLILLDINLPDGSGYELCKEIRINSNVPILILTANDLEVDEVTGLQLGADDYVTKPFRLAVLRARVEALLRRAAVYREPAEYLINNFLFDFSQLHFTKNNKEIILSRTEQKLLYELVKNQGITISRDVLVDRIWTDGAEFVDENALSVSISRLRNKIEDNPSKPQYIHTIYGIGYTWMKKKNEC